VLPGRKPARCLDLLTVRVARLDQPPDPGLLGFAEVGWE
jgi:hypothetical protein